MGDPVPSAQSVQLTGERTAPRSPVMPPGLPVGAVRACSPGCPARAHERPAFPPRSADPRQGPTRRRPREGPPSPTGRSSRTRAVRGATSSRHSLVWRRASASRCRRWNRRTGHPPRRAPSVRFRVPLCHAQAAISTRFRASGLSWALDRCVLTVDRETNSSAAISALVRVTATSRTTSSSRSVSAGDGWTGVLRSGVVKCFNSRTVTEGETREPPLAAARTASARRV